MKWYIEFWYYDPENPEDSADLNQPAEDWTVREADTRDEAIHMALREFGYEEGRVVIGYAAIPPTTRGRIEVTRTFDLEPV